MTYTPRMHYTAAELDEFAIRDLISDAEVSEECVANNGPFTGMTREQHIAYAAKCRAQVEQYRNGGAHKAVLTGFSQTDLDRAALLMAGVYDDYDFEQITNKD